MTLSLSIVERTKLWELEHDNSLLIPFLKRYIYIFAAVFTSAKSVAKEPVFYKQKCE